ncbi:MAG: M15 family metallopeptidase [Lachnospiraceae bacterium]|nr:M15 family metallopeptidase [Lachnospiraceae bacterium]
MDNGGSRRKYTLFGTAVMMTLALSVFFAGEAHAFTQGGVSDAGNKSQLGSTAKLKSLSGIAPGTVIDPAQIDFEDIDKYFMWWNIEEGDNLFARIDGKSYQKNDVVPVSSLKYLKLPHYNFNGQIQVGELVVNADVKDDFLNIFKELFQAQYQIQSMYLVDNYWVGNGTDTDSASIDANNTSAFCFRPATGSENLSWHAYGRAIDINPQQNPYVSYRSGEAWWLHENANDYIARDTGLAHVITYDDVAYKIFINHGFLWSGDGEVIKDYQHFEKPIQ